MERNAIQLFVPTYRIDECLNEIRECLEVGWTGLGYKTVKFEEAWKQYTGLPHAHFVNSATAGLHLAVRILKKHYMWQEGDEIISTPITFVSTNHAILYEGLNVNFADVDEYGCLCPISVRKAINSRTRAIVFVGLGGNVGQIEQIQEICAEHRLRLILDAAHMAGTRFRGVVPGRDADAVVYSFQAVKNLPTADSGMICFNDAEHDKVARQMSWLGIDKDTFTRTNSAGAYKWYYDVPDLGYKEHGNSIMAAIGLVQLKYLDRDNAYRRQIAQWYNELLGSSPNIRPVPVMAGCESSRHLYQVRVDRRDEVLLALNNANIFPGVHYRDNREFSIYERCGAHCPNASEFSSQVMSLPLHLRMSRDDVEYICQHIRTICK